MSMKTMLLAIVVLLSGFCVLDAIGSYRSQNAHYKPQHEPYFADAAGGADWSVCDGQESISPAPSATEDKKLANTLVAAKPVKSDKSLQPANSRQSLRAQVVDAVLPPCAGLLGLVGLGLLLRKCMLLRRTRSFVSNAAQLATRTSGPNVGQRRADAAHRRLPLHVAGSGLSQSPSSPSDPATTKDRKLRRAA
jgi:hypothetical protein